MSLHFIDVANANQQRIRSRLRRAQTRNLTGKGLMITDGSTVLEVETNKTLRSSDAMVIPGVRRNKAITNLSAIGRPSFQQLLSPRCSWYLPAHCIS
jgi:hypothetical protein